MIHYTYAELQVPYILCTSCTMLNQFSFSYDCWTGLMGQMMKYPFVVLFLPGRMCANACLFIFQLLSFFSCFFFFLFSLWLYRSFIFCIIFRSSSLRPRVHFLLRVDLTRNKFTIISQLHLLIVWILRIGISEWFICLALRSCVSCPQNATWKCVHRRTLMQLGNEWLVSIHTW